MFRAQNVRLALPTQCFVSLQRSAFLLATVHSAVASARLVALQRFASTESAIPKQSKQKRERAPSSAGRAAHPVGKHTGGDDSGVESATQPAEHTASTSSTEGTNESTPSQPGLGENTIVPTSAADVASTSSSSTELSVKARGAVAKADPNKDLAHPAAPMIGPQAQPGYANEIEVSKMLGPQAVRGKIAGFTKSTSTMAAEQRDARVYTMQEYMQLDDVRKQKGVRETIADQMDHPGWNLGALFIIATGFVVVVISMRLRRERFNFDPRMRQIKSIDLEGGISIGGPFSLVDTNGRRWTNEDFKGKWLWIYFGFTNCPDVCPQEMAKMTRCITALDKRVGPDYWQPLFISIDAKRDTPQALKEYLKGFHPRILGLTGTREEVESVAREYRVYYAVPDEHDESLPDYLIDHSIIMYLMDPEGKFCDYTTKEFTWFESLSKLLRRMIDYEKKKSEVGAANLKVANIDSMHPNTDAAIGKTDRVPSLAEAERAKRLAGANKSNPHMLSPDVFDSWKKPEGTSAVDGDGKKQPNATAVRM